MEPKSKKITHSKLIYLAKENSSFKGKTYEMNIVISSDKYLLSLGTKPDFVQLIFEECTFQKGVNFKIDLTAIKLKSLSIVFKNCIFNEFGKNNVGGIESNDQFKLSVQFKNCILDNTYFRGLVFNLLEIRNCVLKNSRFFIGNSEISIIKIINTLGRIQISECEKSKITIRYDKFNLENKSNFITDSMKFISKDLNSIFDIPIEIFITHPKEVDIAFIEDVKKGIKNNPFYLEYSDFANLNFSIAINFHDNFTEKVDIKDAFLDKLTLRKHSEAKIKLTNCSIDCVSIVELGFEDLRIFNLNSKNKERSIFHTNGVDFKNATFDKVDLSCFGLVNFYRSTLENINFISPKLSNEIFAFADVESKEEDNYKSKSENYRQLKKSFLQSGNQVEALEMHSKMYESLRKDPFLSCQDRFILTLNNFSNKFGVSVLRPFGCFIFLSLILFFLYRSTLSEAPFNLGFKNWSSFRNGILANIKFVFEDCRALWILINPTHKLSTLESLEINSTLNSWSLFISYFSRIVMAWIIYQFVVSFRKFSRKL